MKTDLHKVVDSSLSKTWFLFAYEVRSQTTFSWQVKASPSLIELGPRSKSDFQAQTKALLVSQLI